MEDKIMQPPISEYEVGTDEITFGILRGISKVQESDRDPEIADCRSNKVGWLGLLVDVLCSHLSWSSVSLRELKLFGDTNIPIWIYIFLWTW